MRKWLPLWKSVRSNNAQETEKPKKKQLEAVAMKAANLPSQ